MKRWIEGLLVVAILCFFGYGLMSYINDYNTVERWQIKAVKNLMEKTKNADYTDPKKLNLVFKEIDELGWIREPTSKIAFDVWIGTASNVASVIGTIFSIVIYVISRRGRREKIR